MKTALLFTSPIAHVICMASCARDLSADSTTEQAQGESAEDLQLLGVQEMIGGRASSLAQAPALIQGEPRAQQRSQARCKRSPACASLLQDPSCCPTALRLGLDLLPQFAAALGGLPEQVDRPTARGPSNPPETSGRSYLEFPARPESSRDKAKDPKLVRVRVSVPYRVHSRQMLCIGGSQIPFGWSFLSIAKVPMTWTEGDIWQAEVILTPAVILPSSASWQTDC